jgi:hypothetical protein
VFAQQIDPVGAGNVETLARLLELLKEIAPGVTRKPW